MRGTPLPGRAAGAVAWPCRFKPASPTCCLVVLETVTQAGRQWRLWENLAWERKGGAGREGGSGAGWGPGQEAPSTSQAGPPSSLEHPFVRCPPLTPVPWTPLRQTRPPSAAGANNPLGRTPAGGGPREGDASSLPVCPCPVVTARVPPSPCQAAGWALGERALQGAGLDVPPSQDGVGALRDGVCVSKMPPTPLCPELWGWWDASVPPFFRIFLSFRICSILRAPVLMGSSWQWHVCTATDLGFPPCPPM